MPKRLRQCADFIARNPDRVAVSTVAELAAAADVQPSAMMRFCQELGFSGFSQMQRLFRDEYSRKWPDYATRLENLRASGEQRPGVLLAEFVEAGRASLEKLMTTVDPDLLERAVDMLAAAPLIHLVGYRRAYPVASYLAYALEKMAIPCVLHSAVGHLATAPRAPPRRRGPRHHLRPLQRRDRRLRRGRPRRRPPGRRHHRQPVEPAAAPERRCPLLVSEVDVGAFRALSATFALAIALAVARRRPARGGRPADAAILRVPKTE